MCTYIYRISLMTYFLHRCDWMNSSEIRLLIYGLLNDAICSSDCTSQHRMVWLVNGELQSIWKETVRASLVLSWHLPGGTEENCENPQYRRLREEIWTCDLPTTKHGYRFFGLELERMGEKNVVPFLTERLITYMSDWVKAAYNKWNKRWPIRDPNWALLTIRSAFRYPKRSVPTLRTGVLGSALEVKQVPRYPYSKQQGHTPRNTMILTSPWEFQGSHLCTLPEHFCVYFLFPTGWDVA